MVSTFMFVASTIAVSEIDVRSHRIPDQYVAMPMMFALAEALSLGLRFGLTRILESIVVLVLFLLFRIMVQRNFGLGDVKLIAASTLAFGIVGVFVLVLSASVAGIAWYIRFGTKGARIAFAPFLAFGMTVGVIQSALCGPTGMA